MEDRRTVGASSCNSGDGTDQRVQSLIFMMMMMMMILYNYIKMYDEENIKFATAQKAKQIYQYKTVYTDACTTHCTLTVYTSVYKPSS